MRLTLPNFWRSRCQWWGFAALEAGCRRVAGVSYPLWCDSPDWSLSVRGVVHEVQTTSVKNADNALFI